MNRPCIVSQPGSGCTDLRLPRTSYYMLKVLNLFGDRYRRQIPNTIQSKHRTLIVPEQTSSDPLTFTLSPFLTSSGWLFMRKHQSTIATPGTIILPFPQLPSLSPIR